MLRQALNLIVITFMISFLSCCASPGYQALDSGAGYSDTRLDSSTVRVTYYGSVATPDETVQNYLLYRCAQVTLKYGYDYFVIISSSTQPIINTYTSPGFINYYTNKKGTAGYAYYTGGQSMTVSREIASAVIKMYSGTKPSSMTNAFAARDIQKYLTPVVSKTKN